MQVNSLNDIQNIVHNGSQIGHIGAYGTVILYDNHLFKFDHEIYDFFLQDNFRNLDFLGLIRSVYYKEVAKPSVTLMDHYNSVRKNVRLTKLPTDILFYKDKPLAYVLPYHNGYQELCSINPNKYLEYLIFLLNKVLESLHELEDNGIYQLDLNYGENVLCKNENVQIIDLDGEYLKIGNSRYRKMVYMEYLKVIKQLISSLKRDNLIAIDEKMESSNNPYEESKRIVKELKKML